MTDAEQRRMQEYKNTEEGNEISAIELATVLGEEKRLLFGLPFLAAITSIAITLSMPPIFTAKVSMLPSSAGSPAGGIGTLLSEVGGLASIAGLSLGESGSNQTYIGILRSESAANLANERFGLMDRYELLYRDQLTEKLADIIQIEVDKKSQIITLTVDDKDPQFAADLANGYYDILLELQNRLAITQAQKKRAFFEDQFQKAKEQLANAEVNLSKVQEETGVLELETQANSTISALANVRAQIASKEVKLKALRSFATTNNPEYQQTLAELSGLQDQLRKLDANSPKGGQSQRSFGDLSAAQLPKTGLEYVRALREVKYHQAIFEVMAKQFEFAKLEEAKEGNGLQLLDPAVKPERKTKPKRAQIVILATLAAGFIAILLAIFRGALRTNRLDPEQNEKIKQLKKAWLEVK